MRRWWRLAIAVVWLGGGLLEATASARGVLDGDPLITRLQPDLDLYLQNFDIDVDDHSVVHVAGHGGVMTYDGAAWRLIKTSNGDIVRSLRHDGHGRVYVGGFNAFGYLQRDASGIERYYDLTAAAGLGADESIADIWQIVVSGEGVFFRALEHLFRFDPASGVVRTWRYPQRYGAMVEHDGELLLQFRGHGLMRWTGDDWALLPGGERLQDHVWKFVPIRDANGPALLALCADGVWRQLRNGRVGVRRMPPEFPESNAFSDGMPLEDGTVALAGTEGEVYVYAPAVETYWRFRVDHDFLAGLARARDGGLLVASQEAAFHVQWPAPWTVLGPEQGWSRALNKLVQWRGQWFGMTASGVYRIWERHGRPEFDRQAWSDIEAWDLLPIDDETALLADTYGVRLIRNDRAQPLTDDSVYPRLLMRSGFEPETVFVGTESGIVVLRRSGGVWTESVRVDDMDEAQVLTAVELARGELWLGTSRDGIHRLRFDPGYGELLESTRYAESDLAYGGGAEARIVRLDGKLVAATAAGFFEWNGQAFQASDLGGLADLRRPGELLELAQAPDGRRWAFSFNRIYREVERGHWRQETLGSFRHGQLQALGFDDAGAALFSATHGVLRFDPARAPDPAANGLELVLRGIEVVGADGVPTAQPLPDAGGSIRVPFGGGTLAVHFALPDLAGAARVVYRSRLVGLEAQATEWSEMPSVAYSRLPPGDYGLRISARDSRGHIVDMAPLRILVEAPWYASPAARVLWIAVLMFSTGILITAIVRWRTLRLRLQAHQLEAMVAERTTELEIANQRLHDLAHLDGLTEIPNRRRLDTYLDMAWNHSIDGERPISLLAIDLDHFKVYNDNHGHLEGDELLKRVASELKACLRRDSDLLARFGGDEFMAIFPGVELRDAAAIARRMQQRIESMHTGVTVSIGVAECRPIGGDALRGLQEAADRAVYQAKASGRNRVCVDGDEAAA